MYIAAFNSRSFKTLKVLTESVAIGNMVKGYDGSVQKAP